MNKKAICEQNRNTVFSATVWRNRILPWKVAILVYAQISLSKNGSYEDVSQGKTTGNLTSAACSNLTGICAYDKKIL